MIHPYNTSIPPCYKAPNIAICRKIQYIQHYNIKRGSWFNAELILKLINRQQYVYYQNQMICFAQVIHRVNMSYAWSFVSSDPGLDVLLTENVS